jgi:glycosyltransferase involved in cell wall biosynthesis
MRILHVNDYAYALGGAESYLGALVRAQRDSGHEAELLASDSRGGGTLALADASARFMGRPRFEARGISLSSRLWRAAVQMWNPSAGRAAARALREYRPDLVHVHTYLSQLSPAVLRPFFDAGVPLLHTSHTYRIACPKGDRMLRSGVPCTHRVGLICASECSAASLLHMRVRHALYHRPQAVFADVIAPSSAMAEILRLEGFTSVRVLPYGIARVRNAAPRRPHNQRVLYAGRLSPPKGVAVLIEAMRIVQSRFPSAELRIAGEGPARAGLERLAGARLREGSCVFEGYLDADALATLRDGCLMQCVPSLWPDVSPLVIYEALAAGAPLVASAIGGIPDLVREGHEALLVPPGSAQSLADAIMRLLSDTSLCERMSGAALQRAVALSMDNHVAAVGRVYAALIAGRACEPDARATRV